MESLSPFTVVPRAVEAVWGDGRLRDLLGRDLPADRPIGETWEVHDEDRVEGGPLAGATLAEAAARAGEALLGRRGRAAVGPTRAFPLLLKFIDAAAMLSVQVHPTDQDEPGRGKTEAYYVLEARPGAKLYFGLRPETDRAALRRAIEELTLDRHMDAIEVAAGDVVYTPAGTVHAFGGGLVFFEIQQCSTVTYRLYDWGRVGIDGRPRELHVEESLRVARFPAAAGPPQSPALCARPGRGAAHPGRRAVLRARGARSERSEPARRRDIPPPDLPRRWCDSRRRSLRRSRDPVRAHADRSPASACGDYRYSVSSGGRMLRSYVPDLQLTWSARCGQLGTTTRRFACSESRSRS